MKRKSLKIVVVSSFVLAFAALVVAQAPETPKPKPGPEHAKLAYFVGNWQSDGTIKENPVFPAGKMTSKDRCEWFDGKFAVICHSEGTSPLGATKGIGIMSYSPESKTYTYYGTDSSGMMIMTSVPHGKVEGKTWTYDDESKMGDVTMKSRYIMNEQSPTSYTFKYEIQGPDGAWITLMEGTSTKKG